MADYKESRHELENDRDRLHNIYISQTRTIHQLKRRIALINEEANRIVKDFSDDFLSEPHKGYNSLGTMVDNIEIASDLSSDESDYWNDPRAYAKGGVTEKRVYAIDPRDERVKDIAWVNELTDVEFMYEAEDQGLVWSSWDSYMDSNERRNKGRKNLIVRTIEVGDVHYAKGGVPKNAKWEYPIYFDSEGKGFVAIYYSNEEDVNEADEDFDNRTANDLTPDVIKEHLGDNKWEERDVEAELGKEEFMNDLEYYLQTSSISPEKVDYAKGGYTANVEEASWKIDKWLLIDERDEETMNVWYDAIDDRDHEQIKSMIEDFADDDRLAFYGIKSDKDVVELSKYLTRERNYAKGGKVEDIISNYDPKATKYKGDSKKGYSVLVKDKNSDFTTWVDVWIQDNDVITEWNQYIFHHTDPKDVRQQKLQENDDIFDYATSEAVEYLKEQKKIYDDDDGWYNYAQGGRLAFVNDEGELVADGWDSAIELASEVGMEEEELEYIENEEDEISLIDYLEGQGYELKEDDMSDEDWDNQEIYFRKGGYRANRPSPSVSATEFLVGTKKRGNDGNLWEIRANINGIHRWVKLK